MSTPVLLAIHAPAVGDTSAPAFTQVSADAPLLRVTDRAVTRGDGIFESVGVMDGRMQALDAHLARLARSARILDLPAPDADVWARATRAAVAAHEPAPERFAKLIMTRGPEHEDRPTAWVYVDDMEDYTAQRSEGIAVVTLSRGYPRDVVQTSPWLLQGAKTLSYAVHMAMLREAERRGAEDVIMTTSDGYLLEGPTSTLLVRLGDRLVTPRTDEGILAGTTQASAFSFLRDEGYDVAYESLPVEALSHSTGLWLLSSLRLAAPVRAVDRRPVAVDHALTDRLNDHLAARTQ